MDKIAVVQREVEKDVFEVALGPIKMRVKRDELRGFAVRSRDCSEEKPIRWRRRANRRAYMLR